MNMKDVVQELHHRSALMADAFKNLPAESAVHYGCWCAQSYFWVRHSVPLLIKASRKMPDHRIRQVFKEHIDEEAGHHKMLVDDLHNLLGVKPSAYAEYPETKAMYDAVYAAIEHHPESMVGYILALETLAAHHGPGLTERVKLSHEGRAHSFIEEHALLDQDHCQIMESLLEDMNTDQLKASYELMLHSLDSIAAILHKVRQENFTSDLVSNIAQIGEKPAKIEAKRFGMKIMDSKGWGVDDSFYNDCFAMWKDVWTETVQDLSGNKDAKVNCDSWFSANRIIVLTFDGKPIAMAFMTFCERGKLMCHINRGVLQEFPEDMVWSEMKKTDHDILALLNQLTVDRQFRKNNKALPVRVPLLLMALMFRVIEQFHPCLMLIYSRNDVKANEMAFSFGFEPLLRNQIRHNTMVDFSRCESQQLTTGEDAAVEAFAQDIYSRFVAENSYMPG